MEKKPLLARKPDAVFVDAVVTVAYAMTRQEYWDTMPGKKCEIGEKTMAMPGHYVVTYANGLQTGNAHWTTDMPSGRKAGLAFSEALAASRLGMFVAREAWDKHGTSMVPVDTTWSIETKGLPPLWCRTTNKCTMPLSLNVPDFIANDWYIVDEPPRTVFSKDGRC